MNMEPTKAKTSELIVTMQLKKGCASDILLMDIFQFQLSTSFALFKNSGQIIDPVDLLLPFHGRCTVTEAPKDTVDGQSNIWKLNAIREEE